MDSYPPKAAAVRFSRVPGGLIKRKLGNPREEGEADASEPELDLASFWAIARRERLLAGVELQLRKSSAIPIGYGSPEFESRPPISLQEWLLLVPNSNLTTSPVVTNSSPIHSYHPSPKTPPPNVNSKPSNLLTESLNDDAAVLLVHLYHSTLEYLGGGDTLSRPLRPLVEYPTPGTCS